MNIATSVRDCSSRLMKNVCVTNCICVAFHLNDRSHCQSHIKARTLTGYKIDLIAEQEIIVELKAIEKILPVHKPNSLHI